MLMVQVHALTYLLNDAGHQLAVRIVRRFSLLQLVSLLLVHLLTLEDCCEPGAGMVKSAVGMWRR
jgi:hypothetical protein